MQWISLAYFLLKVSMHIHTLDAKLQTTNLKTYFNDFNKVSKAEQQNWKIGENDFHKPQLIEEQELLGISENDNSINTYSKPIDNALEHPKKTELIKAKLQSSRTKTTTTTTSSDSFAQSNTKKKQRLTSFINSFGQLGTYFGNYQFHYLQNYNFLFNAEKHTIFKLHTSSVKATRNQGSNNAGRVLNAGVVGVGGSLSAALGVNAMTAATAASDSASMKVEEVKLYNATSLRQSRFNPFNPTRILIHGWFGGSHSAIFNTLVPEYLRLDNGTYNVFTIDWGRGAIADYITASYRVKSVGKIVGRFIDFLHRESGMRFEDLHVIGFSMGAHIAGIAGKFIQAGRIPIIYALDPALPLFRYEKIDERIALTDADYVEVIHTSAGSYGYDQPLGHVDFYVNYGNGQPGCFFNECSHFRAFQVFAESLQNPDSFYAQGCDVKWWLDLIKNRRCLMGTGRNLTIGGDPKDVQNIRQRGGGVYYLTTNAQSPFGKG